MVNLFSNSISFILPPLYIFKSLLTSLHFAFITKDWARMAHFVPKVKNERVGAKLSLKTNCLAISVTHTKVRIFR